MSVDLKDYPDSVSVSRLKKLAASPRILEGYYFTKTIPWKDTDPMEFGTAVHMAVFEPERFETEYIHCPYTDRRRKDYKDWAKEYGIGEPGAPKPLNRFQSQDIANCCKAIRKNEMMGRLIAADGLCEHSLVWTSNPSGVHCKGRLDKIITDFRVCFDLKVIGKVDNDTLDAEFAKSAGNYDSQLQATHYLEACRENFGGDDWEFVFGVVEGSAPFRSRACRLHPDDLHDGEQWRQSLLTDYKARLAAGDWSEPGENDCVTVSVPGWRRKQIRDRF